MAMQSNAISIVKHPTIRGAYRLSAEQWLPRPLDGVFPFFADAMNLQELTPEFLNFRVLTPPPIAMFPGTRIDYRIRLHGVPIRWQSEIAEWDPPHQFVDRQITGPYRLWHHRHTFSEQNGQTLVRDIVEYAVPGGAIVNRLFVRGDLLRIFEYRRKKMESIFGRAKEEVMKTSVSDAFSR